MIGHARIDADGDADVVDFVGAQGLVGIHFPGVEDLAAQRHHRLEVAVARLLGRAAGGIAFDQEQLGARRDPSARSRPACRAAPGRW